MTRFKARRDLQFDVGAAAECVPQPEAWDVLETKALLELVLLYGTSDAWPTFTQSSRFWREAADFVKQRTGGRSLVSRNTQRIFSAWEWATPD